MKLLGYCFGCMLIFCFSIRANAQLSSDEYLQRAELMYKNVWQHYKVPVHTGLFTENFPSKGTDTLTYMEGGGVKEKAVSFLWPFSGMFSATNVLLQIPTVKRKYMPFLDTCIIGMEKYKDTVRSPDGYQAYPVKFEKSDRYYDDNGLVGIDYMESYFNTKNPVYLYRAEEVFRFILSGWNNDLGGAVTWLEGHKDQKPACSNGTATLVALKIYEGSKNKFYLNWGKNFYDWMYTNLLDSTGVISNDKKLDGKVNRKFYTYNTGFMIEAAVLLYNFTGEKKYLEQAKEMAKSSYKYFSAVPHDKNLNLYIDLPWFVTVLFRGYEALYLIDGNYQYLAAIEKDLNYAWQNSRDKFGLVTSSWTANARELASPKRLLDQGCIAELYARLSILKKSPGK
jgi:hypothetical protein